MKTLLIITLAALLAVACKKKDTEKNCERPEWDISYYVYSREGRFLVSCDTAFYAYDIDGNKTPGGGFSESLITSHEFTFSKRIRAAYCGYGNTLYDTKKCYTYPEYVQLWARSEGVPINGDSLVVRITVNGVATDSTNVAIPGRAANSIVINWLKE